MSTQTALVVIDVQVDVVQSAHRRDETIAAINGLVNRARIENIPVVWVQHADGDLPTGSPGWEIHPDLSPLDGDVKVHKKFRDSFEQTAMKGELERLDVGRLVVTGAQTDYCVRWTLHGALVRGYDTVLVSDAHTTDDPSDPSRASAAQLVAHLNDVWGSQAMPGTSVSDSASVSFQRS